MDTEQPPVGLDWQQLAGTFLDTFAPFLPVFVGIIVLCLVLRTPLPGRGPSRGQGRDPWRGFKYEPRRIVMAAAGGRCEGHLLLGLGRCGRDATEVDHVYPWSRNGPTIVSNGAALCGPCNRQKSNMTPPWWLVVSLERRRRSYYPAGASVRVSAAMTQADRDARAVAVRRIPRSRPPA